MASNPETLFQNKVLRFLEEQGGYWHKVHVSSFSSAGIPDIIGCYKGRFVALELKRPDGKGRVSELQKYHIEKINEAGGYAAVISSIEELKELFK